MTTINTRSSFGSDLLSELRELKQTTKSNDSKTEAKEQSTSFMDHLQESVKTVNEQQKFADKAATDLATGKSQNIHETMLASSQAEITFNLMVQVRNKALQAYQEVMRMPV